MRSFCVSIILLLTAVQSYSAIQMQCASVGASGDVTINWNNTGSSAGFYAYYIFHSTTATGPFILIDSIFSYPNQTYTDVNANALNTNAFYYVMLMNTSGLTTLSDTIEAIKLTVSKVKGLAVLAWNTTHSPLIASNYVNYRIYREYPAGVWTLIDSLDMSKLTPNDSDEVTICADTIKYRIEVTDGSGCISVSNVDGKFFQDKTAPSVPLTDSVSVDASGNAVIGWDVNPSKDTYAYVVLQYINNQWVAIDTLYGINNTFLATTVNVTGGTQQFSVYAVDSCSNRSINNAPQEPIVIKGTIDPCNASVRLYWNAYINSPAIPNYTVLMSENGGNEIVVNSTVLTSYNIKGLKTDTSYCFRIMATLDSVGSTSTSTIFCIKAQLPVLPKFAYIKSVSVNSATQVVVQAYVDILANVKQYRLLRSVYPFGGFSIVSTLSGNIGPFITFQDGSITDADKKVYYYQVVSTDSCGSIAQTSQTSHTIVATAVAHDDFTNTVGWNNYDQWLGGVLKYNIARTLDSTGNPVQIGSVLFGDTSFLDKTLIDYSESSGKFCYRIIAYEGNGNKYGFIDTSYSAEVCVGQLQAVFIPNAFRPGGYFNTTFNPAERFIGSDGYDLKIFNRWGQVIFETTNPGQGWDGSSKGNYTQPDVYCWLLTYRNNSGTTVKKVGRVTLVE